METQAENKVSGQQTDLDKVSKKIVEIMKKSADGDYIYRGEPEYYEKVSSNLYREYEEDIEAEHFDIAVVQEEILKEAREYITHKMDDPEILTQLQHYGGKTNLIDFTTDYLVALFFACNGNPDKPGRVILLGKDSEAYNVLKPPRTITRAEAQKSIFVQAQQGFVTPDKDKVVCIPADLKGAILEYLRKHHDISTKTIYNDLHGFIENRRIHKSGYTEFYKGLTSQGRADSAKTEAQRQDWHDDAIEHYTAAINWNPENAEVYNNRGLVYTRKSDFAAAIDDYNKAIGLDPEAALVYNNRGLAYADTGNFQAAIDDYNTAIDLDPEDAGVYGNRGNAYRDTGDFEAAIQDYSTAIDLVPENADAYNNRGNAYSDKGEFDSAIQDYNTALNLNTEYADAYNNRGNVYYEKGDFDAAIDDFNTAIDLVPENAIVYNNRGVAYRDTSDFEAAIDDFNTAIDLSSEDARFYQSWCRLPRYKRF